MTGISLSAVVWMVSVLSAFMGAYVLGLSIFGLKRERDINSRLLSLLARSDQRQSGWQILIARTEWLGRRLDRGADVSRNIRELLTKAGYFHASALYVFLTLRVAATVMIIVITVTLRGADPVSILVAGFLAVLFYRYALIAVKYQGERRARRIQRELPSILDIILMVLDSGISIDQCLHYVSGVVASSAPAAGAVLCKHVAEVDSGVPYDLALDRLGQRLAVDEGVDFANLLKQAIFHGGELGPSLRRFSAELSDRRLSRAREEGGRRATYLTIVMVFFFVPVLMVILVGPAAVQVTATIKSVAHRAHASHANEGQK